MLDLEPTDMCTVLRLGLFRCHCQLCLLRSRGNAIRKNAANSTDAIAIAQSCHTVDLRDREVALLAVMRVPDQSESVTIYVLNYERIPPLAVEPPLPCIVKQAMLAAVQ
jgi:hypothetical protein